MKKRTIQEIADATGLLQSSVHHVLVRLRDGIHVRGTNARKVQSLLNKWGIKIENVDREIAIPDVEPQDEKRGIVELPVEPTTHDSKQDAQAAAVAMENNDCPTLPEDTQSDVAWIYALRLWMAENLSEDAVVSITINIPNKPTERPE